MLLGIPRLLTPELIKLMMEMGHDDALVLADANFTAHSLAAGKPVVRLPGLPMLEVVQAVAQLLPLAVDVPHPVAYMQVGGSQPPARSALQREVLAVLEEKMAPSQRAQGVERYDFYKMAGHAYAFVLTGELQPWGNFILRKGVIGENLRP
jgi:L-fucose mutarotase